MRLNRLRSLFKRSPLLYRLAFKYYLKGRFGGEGRIPERGDDLYFDGFPRSGNSSFVKYLRESNNRLDKILYSSHLHCIATIKIAQSRDIPIFIIYRDPLESISSWYYHLKSDPDNLSEMTIDWMIGEWLSYYNYCIRKNDIGLFSLDNFRNDPVNFIATFNEKAQSDLLFYSQEIFNKYIQLKTPKPSQVGEKLSGNSTQPTVGRERAKGKVKDYIMKHHKYNNLLSLHKALIEQLVIR